MSMSMEDCAKYVLEGDDGWEISKEVPGGQIPFGHGLFDTHDDALLAVKAAFTAYRAGMWRKQQDFRNLLGIRGEF